jgi:hypothetical protein
MGKVSDRAPRRRGDTSARSAARFLALREADAYRPPDSAEFLASSDVHHRIPVTEESCRRIRAEAKRRGIRDAEVLEDLLRPVLAAIPISADAALADDVRRPRRSGPWSRPPRARRAPNRRGEGASYRAAELCRQGMSLEEAAAREQVAENSVIRVIRFGKSRVG